MVLRNQHTTCPGTCRCVIFDFGPPWGEPSTATVKSKSSNVLDVCANWIWYADLPPTFWTSLDCKCCSASGRSVIWPGRSQKTQDKSCQAISLFVRTFENQNSHLMNYKANKTQDLAACVATWSKLLRSGGKSAFFQGQGCRGPSWNFLLADLATVLTGDLRFGWMVKSNHWLMNHSTILYIIIYTIFNSCWRAKMGIATLHDERSGSSDFPAALRLPSTQQHRRVQHFCSGKKP